MFKKITFLVLIFTFNSISSQNKIEEVLDSITNIENAETFLKNKKNRKNKIITFNEEKHKTKLSKSLLKLNEGGTKVVKNEIEKVHYKILEKNEIVYYRVSYIFLDGTQIPISKIEKLREVILSKHNLGISFKDLARQYSMDGNSNRGGDLGWFTYGEMMPEFEQQVMNNSHNVGDVFMVDVESNKWYYVVKKTHDKKSISEIKVLKIVESRR